MIQLVDLGENYHEFKTVDDALGFLWGQDVNLYRVLIPTSIPQGYAAAKALLETGNVSSKDGSRLDQPRRTPPVNGGGNVPAVRPRGSDDASGQSEERSEQSGDSVEEVQNGVSGTVSIGLGFQAGPRR